MSGSAKVGWSPKEILWLRAALTLPGYACVCALDDIASMSGRTISAVRRKADQIQKEAEPATRNRAQAEATAYFGKGVLVRADSIPENLRSKPRVEAAE